MIRLHGTPIPADAAPGTCIRGSYTGMYGMLTAQPSAQGTVHVQWDDGFTGTTFVGLVVLVDGSEEWR